MDQQPGIISTENTRTIVAVAFVIALMSLVFNYFLYQRINEVVGAVAAYEIHDAKSEEVFEALPPRIDALQAEVDALKAQIAEMKAAPPAPAEGGAE